jgi:predicted RNase H-like HicB family nuclease
MTENAMPKARWMPPLLLESVYHAVLAYELAQRELQVVRLDIKLRAPAESCGAAMKNPGFGDPRVNRGRSKRATMKRKRTEQHYAMQAFSSGTHIFKEGGVYVAYSPARDLSSCGDTEEEAWHNIGDAVAGLLKTTAGMGPLGESVEEAGLPPRRRRMVRA